MFRRLIPCVSLIFCLSSCEKEAESRETIVNVKAMQITDPSRIVMSTFTGRAEATNEVNLGFEVSGTIIERPVNKGDQMKEGQVLARLDPRDFQSELDAVNAELQRATAYRDRIAEALKKNAVARQDLTDAEARVEAANARVRIKEKALEDSVIKAPFDGVIAWTYKERFQRVAAKEIVVRLLDISEIEFTVSIPESMISSAHVVEEVFLRFDAFPEHTMHARIKEIGTEATAATRTFPVTLIFTQSKEVTILPGMTGTTAGGKEKEEYIQPTDTFTIPLAAVFTGKHPGTNFVWMIDRATMTVRAHEVMVERTVSDGAIVRGLEKGQWIVTAGVFHIKSGQQVQIIERLEE